MSTDATEIIATPPEPRPGTTDDKLLLHFNEIGAVPDRIVAAKAGVAINTVRNFRTHHGIPSSRPIVSARAKKPGRKAKATTDTPSTKGKAGRKSKIEPLHDLVGTMPDEDLAAKAGAAVSTVESYRRRHNIPAYAAPGEASGGVLPPEAGSTSSEPSSKPRRAAKGIDKAKEKGRPGRKSKIKPFQDLVGQVPDEEVAQKAGVGVEAVHAYRRKNAIPAPGGATKGSTEKRPAKAPTPTSSRERTAAKPTLWGWRVTFVGEQMRLVIAPDVGRAASVGAQAGLGEVVQIERLVEALG